MPRLRVAVDISPLRESVPYRALLSGHAVSLIGNQMRFVAMAWHIFVITGSSLSVGLLGLAELLPQLFISLFAGAAADSLDRKKIMRWAQSASFLNALALSAWALLGDLPLPAIYGFAAIGASFDALDRPARTATVPSYVSKEKLPAAMALRQIVFQTSHIIGPAIGGVLIATFSIGTVYIVDAATFLVSIASLRWLPHIGERPHRGHTRVLLKEGLKFVLSRPLVRTIFAVDLVAMIFGMPRAVFPALADSLGMGADGAGLLFAAPAVGALAGALFSGWVGGVVHQGRAIFLAVFGWGLAITGAGLATSSLPLMLVLFAAAGGSDVLSAVFRGTVLLQTTPDHLRGRVSALDGVVVTGGPRLGDVEAGLVACAIGPAASVVVGGAACVMFTGALWLKSPLLRAYRSVATAEV